MEIRQNKNSTSYREKVSVPGRKTPIKKTFKRIKDARDWKRRMETEVRQSQALGVKMLKENLTFKEICDVWLKRKIEPVKSFKTVADYKSMCNRHLIPNFGSIQIRSIERSHADQLIAYLRDIGLQNKTSNKVLTLFKQIVLYAEIEGFLVKSPLTRFPLLNASAGNIDYLSQQEILQLLRSNSGQECYPLLVVVLNTGMRIGELTGLCWDRINFESDYIEISRNQTRNGLKDDTKTHRVRHIPMNEEVKTTLLNLMGLQRSPKYVFTKSNGDSFNPDHYSAREFNEALQRAGLRKVNFHITRHTYASHYMMNGGDIYDLQKILGHTKIEMTMKYAHLSPKHLRNAVNTVRFSAEGNKGTRPILAPQDNNVYYINRETAI